ncbi:MAG: recombinase family protein [Patescibacteria group bacterium]|nr:recombinase family protein [Patescibacteria group bacterium]
MHYFLYARKSTDVEDKQVLSIEAQLSELRALARREGLEITEEFVEKRSAKQPGRPVFNEMMARIQRGEAQGIVCWKIDRLARNPVDGGQIQWLLQTSAPRVGVSPSPLGSPSLASTSAPLRSRTSLCGSRSGV